MDHLLVELRKCYLKLRQVRLLSCRAGRLINEDFSLTVLSHMRRRWQGLRGGALFPFLSLGSWLFAENCVEECIFEHSSLRATAAREIHGGFLIHGGYFSTDLVDSSLMS
jgi:hypothetical protein